MRSRIALLFVALLVLPIAVSPAGAGTADKVAVGYRIPRDGTAGGGWIGARTVWPHLVYRLDPGARKARTPGFRPVRHVEVLDGRGAKTVTRRDTARAAYLLSAFGARRSHRPQNAAVEAAIDHLLVGGSYALSGWRTRARIGHTGGDRAEIRFLADYMLSDSWEFAGPYVVRIVGRGADLGGTASVRIRVTAKPSGRGFATLPVTVRVPGQPAITRETAADGTVEITWPANRAGLLDVGIRIAEVPETRLLVRAPTRRGASRVAIAGEKRVLERRVIVPVRALPEVTVASPPTARVGQPTTGTFTVGHGVDSARTATSRLFGPFATTAEAVCAGTPRMTSTSTVTADGGYPLPAATIGQVGYYVWGVSVAANRVNAAASGCGAPFVARTQPKLTIKVPKYRVTLGASLRAWWTVGQLPPNFQSPLTIRLYGPFADADHVSCAGTTTRSAKVALAGPASGWSESYAPGKPGLYAWRTSLPATEFSFAGATVCGGAFTMVRVVRP